MQCCPKIRMRFISLWILTIHVKIFLKDLYLCSCLRMLLYRLALRIHLFFSSLFQHTFSSLLKQKPPKTSPTKSRGPMAVSMREVDPVFQGAGQKEYPSVSSLLLVTISILIPACRFVPRMSRAIIFLITVILLFRISPCCHSIQ